MTAKRYRVWSERQLPEEFAPMLAGIAVIAAPGAHALIAGSRVRYDGALMDENPDLCVISRAGIGVDNVVVAEATARNIVVCNAPDAPTIGTAEMAITLMLAVAREVKRMMWMVERRPTADGRPQSEEAAVGGQRSAVDFYSAYHGLELYGRTLGLVGLGRIGSRVARMAQALGMRVVGFDPYISPERAAAMGVELAPSLEALLPAADVVSLHAPLLPETLHLIDAEGLAMMKPGAILINTARGGLVDERALVKALDQGHLRGAGLDVLQQEPPPSDHPLLGRDNVIITPHVASATDAGKVRLWQTAIEQALQVLCGERPANIVNPEVWERRRIPK